MTAPSYHLQQTSVHNQGQLPKTDGKSFGVGNFSNDSESGSDDCNLQKIKKRSHRPRGCRGGGSRRARKERRELQFLEMKRQQQEQIQLLNSTTSYQTDTCVDNEQNVSSVLVSSSSSSSTSSSMPSFLSYPNMAEGTYIIHKSSGLPHLQSSLSFSSNESDSSERLNCTNRASNFDILPSMPVNSQRGNSQKIAGQCYMSMAALPPLSSAIPSTFHMSQSQKSAEEILRLNVPYNDSSIISNPNKSTRLADSGIDQNFAMPNLSDGNMKILPSFHLERKEDFLNVQPKTIFTDNITLVSQSTQTQSSGGHNIHNGERFLLTRKILAETGSSFFATSPKSFLLGKKKSTVFCF
jgi:hypothetical protein